MTPYVLDRMEALTADITQLAVDAIVNAANSTLLGGGGVDGAIHRAAGPELREACRLFQGCPTGEARITRGFNLPAEWVIHTVGPVWQGGDAGEDEQLAACYRASLALARNVEAASIAFPAISTGAYRFPAQRATRIAVRTVRETLPSMPSVHQVVFVSFSPEKLDLYESALRDARAGTL